MNAFSNALSRFQSKTPSKETLYQLAVELDALRDQIRADLGEKDADYIRKIIRQQRTLEVVGRALLHFSFTPIGFTAGVAALGTAKIMENMEIGHNVLHGQYDWMNDPKINSSTWEWDNVCDSQSWKRTHNYEHHTYTNIIGKDRDYGYAILRLSDDTPWHPMYRFQFIYYVLLSTFFEWGVALHEMETEKLRSGEIKLRDKKKFFKEFFSKSSKQVFKDYVFFPALAGPFFLKVLAGNALANLTRNLWASTIIFCGHFTESAQTFTEEECRNETRGHWYYRQLLGSSNFEGSKFLHMMSGHLSYQIEHHLFPDIPACRYPEMSIKVREICERHGIQYNTGSFFDQYKTVVKRIVAYSKPPAMEAIPA
jgi:fatty acid desaturase